MQDNFKIPARRSWQHCQDERFHGDASNIAMDRTTIGDTGPSATLETSPQ
ncbi:hypothetical protein PQQ75_25175 [Paraburkholderia aspalathi]